MMRQKIGSTSVNLGFAILQDETDYFLSASKNLTVNTSSIHAFHSGSTTDHSSPFACNAGDPFGG